MKRLLLAITLGLAALLPAPKAECRWCYQGACFNSQICANTGCVCLMESGQFKGRCVSLQ